MFKVNSAARVIAASVMATAFAATSFADMVYDDERSMSPAPTSPASVEVRNVISQNAEVASTQPVIVSSSETIQVQKVSERSREKRGFQESVNNELVIQKLEDRRLKQEEKLTAEINKKFTLEDDAPAGTAAPVMKEEVVVKPIASANASYEMSAAPKGNAAAANAIVTDEVNMYQSSTNMSVAPVSGKPEGEKAFKSGVSITPKAGLSTISNDFYDFQNQYVLGAALGFDVSDHVSVDLGYTYADYQVAPRNFFGFNGFGVNPLTYKTNTFDFGLRLYLTGLDAKVRPYVGGGMAYSVGYVNYDQRTLGNFVGMPAWNTQDYRLNQFQGMLQAGLDFQIAKNVAIGAGYKFFRPISSNENQQFYNGAFFSPFAVVDPNIIGVSRSLRDSNMQMFLVNASIKF